VGLNINEIYGMVADGEEGTQCGKREDGENLLVVFRPLNFETFRQPTCFDMLGHVDAPTFWRGDYSRRWTGGSNIWLLKVLTDTDKWTPAYLELNILSAFNVKLRHQPVVTDYKHRIDEFGIVVAEEESYWNTPFDVDVHWRAPSPFGNVPHVDSILGREHGEPIRITVDGDS
jgi:hypothetical protein